MSTKTNFWENLNKYSLQNCRYSSGFVNIRLFIKCLFSLLKYSSSVFYYLEPGKLGILNFSNSSSRVFAISTNFFSFSSS